MSGLVEFLLARVAEDETVARAAGERDWQSGGGMEGGAIVWEWATGVTVADAMRQEDARHVALHDPWRVLAECAAKRAIVEEHHPVDPCDAHGASFETVPCPTLLALAQPFREHPDFDPAWVVA